MVLASDTHIYKQSTLRKQHSQPLQELIKNLMKSRWILGTRKGRLSIENEEGDATANLTAIAMNRNLHLLQTVIIAQHGLNLSLLQPQLLADDRKIVRIRKYSVGVVHLKDTLGELILHGDPTLFKRELQEGVSQ